ncbi:MAG: glycosyltransferase family 39 protein [Candidatus Eisenbacteria bacterium]|nr:glycosyltransferase family 39 protein [Candidatus Eisenbacteria bacterium]
MRRTIVLLFLVAFALRMGAVLAIGEYKRPNTWESGLVADALLEGKGFALDWRTMLGKPPEPDAASTWWSPAYPLLLAACRIVAPGAPYLLVSIVQALLLAAVPVLIFHMGRSLFDERAAWIAALLAAVHPPLLGYAALMQTAALEIFALTLSLALATRVLRETPAIGEAAGSPSRGGRDAFLAGLFLALASLTRGPALALLILAPIAWLAAGIPARRALALSGFLFLGALLLIGPWTARNYRVRGEFVLISSKGGWNLFRGNNPSNTPFAPFDNKRAIQPDLRSKLMEMNEVEGDRALRRLALDYIRAQPEDAFRNMLGRVKQLVWFNEEFGRSSGYASLLRRITRPVYMTAWPLLLAFGALGIAWTRRSWRRLLIYYGTIATIAGVILLTYFENRYRAPLEPILILFAGAALARITGRFSAGR